MAAADTSMSMATTVDVGIVINLPMNTFGHIFRLTTFGESHGEAIGGVVDGMPAGIDIDLEFIQAELNRRRPGQSKITTSRQEPDQVELLSGVFEGKSTGCPIGFIVRNIIPTETSRFEKRNVANLLPVWKCEN